MSACLLDDRLLDILQKSKLTITLIQSIKIKISTIVYLALKSRIDNTSKTQREQHLTFYIYLDVSQRFRILEVESNDAKNIALISKTLNGIASRVARKNSEATIWSSTLSTNSSIYRKFKSIKKELDIVIIRDKSKCQLLLCGSLEKYQ